MIAVEISDSQTCSCKTSQKLPACHCPGREEIIVLMVCILADYHAYDVPYLADYGAVDVGAGQDVDAGHRGAGQLQLLLLVVTRVVAGLHLPRRQVHHPVHLPRLVPPLVQLAFHAEEVWSGAEGKACRVFHPRASSRPVQEEWFAATVGQNFLNHRGVETVGHVILVTIGLGSGLGYLRRKDEYSH